MAIGLLFELAPQLLNCFVHLQGNDRFDHLVPVVKTFFDPIRAPRHALHILCKRQQLLSHLFQLAVMTLLVLVSVARRETKSHSRVPTVPAAANADPTRPGGCFGSCPSDKRLGSYGFNLLEQRISAVGMASYRFHSTIRLCQQLRRSFF